MSVQTKFIIFSTSDNNNKLNKIPSDNELPIVFPNHIDHKVMADVMKGLKLTPISAGFCNIGRDGYFIASGRSETLNLGIRDGDSDIINCYLSGG